MKVELRKCKLKIIADIIDSLHQTPKKYFIKGYPMVRVTDIESGYLNLTKAFKVDENTYNIFIKKYRPQVGDMIFSRVGTYGNISYVATEEKFCLGQNVALIHPRINATFLYYFLLSPQAKNQIESMVVGSTQKTISLKSISNIEISVPDEITQQKIAAILSALDAKIENNNAINRNLEQQAQALYNDMACYGDNVKIGTFIDCVETGSRPKGGGVQNGIPSIGAEKIEKFGVYDFSKETFISEDFYNAMKRGHIKSGDVLLYKDGAYTGKCSMALDGFPYDVCAVNEHVFILRTKNMMYQNFLYCCLRDKVVSTQIYNLACGKAAQPGLNQNELRSVDIRLPKEDMLKHFEKSVYEIMKMIANNALENTRLAALRDTLLPKLMNGEIEV